jgi:cellulose synthase (UDP-forming)
VTSAGSDSQRAVSRRARNLAAHSDPGLAQLIDLAGGQGHRSTASTVGDTPTARYERGGRHQKESAPASPEDSGVFLARELRWLSEGRVDQVSPSGPAIGPARQVRRLRRSTFSWALGRMDRVLIAVMSVAWLACLVAFWVWWLEPGHRVGTFGVIVNSLVLAYVSGFPLVYVGAANRMRRVNPELPVPLLRVAFVVTRAPSEPWTVASRTLDAMLRQDFPFPYDVWLCDEKPTEEIFTWCADHDVRVSTRLWVRSYHRATWPRRTKCKEGNLAYFYDRWGYRSYDVVAQLDCDHVPSPSYLVEMVRPFADPAIGYVAAPSVCDANAANSWSARGRLHREAAFHGPFQLGHGDGLSPVCIGSHYAVRTAAIRQIGGIGPDLAEDFSTTFLLSAAGWHGAFAIDAEAHGDGPNTFAAMLVQEYQWSRSLITVLMGLVPRNLPRLRWRLRLRFIYSLSYYLLVVTTTLVGLVLPPIAAVSGQPWIRVNYLTFLLHWWSISLWLVLVTLLLRRRRLLRPPKAPLISWENWLYCFTRWPFIGMGVCAAILNKIRPRNVSFKVTPKGSGSLEPLPVRILMPYVVCSLLSSIAALVGEHGSGAPGYVFLSVLGALTYATALLAVPILHAREAAVAVGAPFRLAIRSTIRGPLIIAIGVMICAITAAGLFPAYAMRAFGW